MHTCISWGPTICQPVILGTVQILPFQNFRCPSTVNASWKTREWACLECKNFKLKSCSNRWLGMLELLHLDSVASPTLYSYQDTATAYCIRLEALLKKEAFPPGKEGYKGQPCLGKLNTSTDHKTKQTPAWLSLLTELVILWDPCSSRPLFFATSTHLCCHALFLLARSLNKETL